MAKLRIVSNQEIPMVAAVILATTTKTSHNVPALEDDGIRRRIRSWLKPPDPTTNFNTAIGARQVGTGDWFIHGQEFVDWMKAPGSFLWIRGIPGNGKTIICSTVIETLKRRVDSSVALACFYFNFNDSEKLIYRNMLHSLIFQLCNRCPGPLRDLYKRTNDGSQQPTVDELLGTLKKTIGSYSQTYIVIDALDECISSELGEVLKFLAEVKIWNLKNLHILASSRPEQEIMEAVDSLYTFTVDLHDAHSSIKDDI
ncbi:hypothetical protein HETIRDRAFT_415399 [Heterobasidion irregulare TC 32-1]|uniref:Nephrocystin 3-like N-terminal domain-containing protein n=1 Tax=Heterobasidion irregulare (strain TC 32-1) TaxID=747525 RepID=W4KCW6_HETIT|nr:uncharacterized protein HETIRDRAFT_415399 [Heterobasidion irregulare TC 32-1]ETW83628.1 hypothetical protein HETIRDRAFT_415399 [Heterobasidion irregulare TC 32-1]